MKKKAKFAIMIFGLLFLVIGINNSNGVAIADLTFRMFLPLLYKQEPPPTPTITPTISPSPTPTQTTPPGVYIIPNHTNYVNSIGSLHIVGEIWNNTSNHLRYVKVTVNIFNSNDQLVGTDYTYTYLDSLPAGKKTCFDLFLTEPAGWTKYKFEAPTYWTDGNPLPNLTVSGDSGSYEPTFGWYEILGMVANDHGSTIEYVMPVGTLYNSANKVIGCDFTFVNSTHLNPGQSSSFDLTFLDRDYYDADHYKIQVDGNPQ